MKRPQDPAASPEGGRAKRLTRSARMLLARSARTLLGLALAALASGGQAFATQAFAADAKPAPLAVSVTNASEPESCAEKDNVTVDLASPDATHFRIEAEHPAYIGAVSGERREPDWTDCDIVQKAPANEGAAAQGENHAGFSERRVTFYESPFLWITGYEFSDYWRKRDVPVHVGDRVEHNLNMIQLWVFVHGEAQQVMVLYPTDGIWRIHPLPPKNLPWSAYGSSFLVGPVASEERPVVEIKEVSFEPATKTFHLVYASGGSADVKLADVDDDHILLDVSFDHPIANAPFAALRSMYVTETDADVAHIALQQPDAKGWIEAPIMSFPSSMATKVWMGRLVPSRHNISAPDLVFSGFSKEPKTP